jgi:hypothetical protein
VVARIVDLGRAIDIQLADDRRSRTAERRAPPRPIDPRPVRSPSRPVPASGRRRSPGLGI